MVRVEGLPDVEQSEGEEVVDVSEYFGGEDATTATRVVYSQIKHSTLRVDQRIVASELKTTLSKFAMLFRAGSDKSELCEIDFALVANREVSEDVRRSLGELGNGVLPFTSPRVAGLLRGYMGFDGDHDSEKEFCARLEILDGVAGLADLESELLREMHSVLPGGAGGELAQLTEMVARRVSSLSASPAIYKRDVLLALQSDTGELFPAPSSIERLEQPVRTSNVESVVRSLSGGDTRKLLVTAAGGTGKSVLTSQLADGLAAASVVVVYDCFAGGDYRKSSQRRHHHRRALTQLSNEIAAKGLCAPLVPVSADDGAYVRVFMRRVAHAAKQLAARDQSAVLAIVVDAADSAAIAAGIFGEREFASDLLGEDWPPNARLVVLCRPERRELLRVPRSGVSELELVGFGPGETVEHLRRTFADATEADGRRLHALSAGNPRVQAMAIAAASSAADAVSLLAIAAQRPGPALDGLFAGIVAQVVDDGHLTSDELARLCGALGSLNPSIPLDDLARVTGVDRGAIVSFAAALGRGLHATDTSLQFRDEPTETWFRSEFELDLDGKAELAGVIVQHAHSSPYLASALPQLLFEAEMLYELVALALSENQLPGDADGLEAQEVARSRARFALSATLRAGQNADAARLAVRSGALSSGRERKLALIRSNTDLAARFMGASFVEEMCARRELSTDWPGSNLHVEAVLLSHIDDFSDLASARSESALDNLRAILAADDDDLGHPFTAAVAADLAMAAANLDGADGLLEFVQRCSPESFVREFTVAVCSRLVDWGRDECVERVMIDGPAHAQIAAAEVMYDYGIVPSPEANFALIETLRARTVPFDDERNEYLHPPDGRGVLWAIIHGRRLEVLDEAEALRILDLHTEPHLRDSAASGSSTSIVPRMLGFALRSALTGEHLELTRIVSARIADELASESYQRSRLGSDFLANIEPLVPWITGWLDALLAGDTPEVRTALTTLVSERLRRVPTYNTPHVRHNAEAEIAVRALSIVDDPDLVETFSRWHSDSWAYIGGASRLIRLAARSSQLEGCALALLARAADRILENRTEAGERADSLVELARAILATNEGEAAAHFERAIQEADLVDDDLWARWEALFGAAGALQTCAEPARCYRLFQISEALAENDFGDAPRLSRHLLSMHAPTFFAALSRARDRRTLSFGTMLTSAFESAATSPSRWGWLAFYAFDVWGNWRKVVNRLPQHEARSARGVFEAFTGSSSSSVGPSSRSSTTSIRSSVMVVPHRGGAPLAQIDFTTDSGWTAALEAASWGEERRALPSVACNRHQGRHGDVLRALAASPRALIADYAALATEVASRQPTLSVRAALRELAINCATRFARQLSISTKLDDDGDVVAIAEASGLSPAGLRAMAFRELGADAHELSYTDCFQLAGGLCSSLDSADAAAVFDDVAELFEDLAPSATTSDGSFSSLPPVPDTDVTCAAAVIWSALGDMSASVRWKAAHAVVLLVDLHRDEELGALCRLAESSAAPAGFTDERFPFYDLHARQWLLIALARSVHQPSAHLLAQFSDWLVAVAQEPAHAANQLLAQRVLAALVGSEVVSSSAAIDTALVRVLAPSVVEIPWRQRRSVADEPDVEVDDDEPVSLPMEFDRWYDALARVFQRSVAETRQRVGVAAAELLEEMGRDRDVDPRLEANVYGRHRRSSYRRWPDEEDFSFYLGIHSFLTVGAELASTFPAYKDPEDFDDPYSEWLADFLPTRTDSRWLADRRDNPPSPSAIDALEVAAGGSHWPWTMSTRDFERAAGVGDPWVTVYADVDNDTRDQSEEIFIQSALVEPSTSKALLVAMQTLPRDDVALTYPHGTGDRDLAAFELDGWLESESLEPCVDQTDERAAGIRFPPPRPSDDVVAEFALTSDPEMRKWTAADATAFRSRVWSNRIERSSDRDEGTSGQLLEVNLEFLQSLLRARNRTLVLQVSLRWTRRRPDYERRGERDDGIRYLDWSRKSYLFDRHGHWHEF